MNNKNKGIHMNEGWDDIEGFGLIEGYGNFTEGHGIAIDLNPIHL